MFSKNNLAAGILLVVLAGCGTKGPLTLPERAAASQPASGASR